MSDEFPVCVVGVGNADCGDDGVGPVLVDRLATEDLSGVKTLKASGETAGLIEIFSQHPIVVLVDAVAMQTQPGVIHRFDAGESPLPSELFSSYSTHSMGVDEAIEMARVLDELPEKIIVYGIEGVYFEAGDSMCPEVCESMEALIQSVRDEIQTIQFQQKINSN